MSVTRWRLSVTKRWWWWAQRTSRPMASWESRARDDAMSTVGKEIEGDCTHLGGLDGVVLALGADELREGGEVVLDLREGKEIQGRLSVTGEIRGRGSRRESRSEGVMNSISTLYGGYALWRLRTFIRVISTNWRASRT